MALIDQFLKGDKGALARMISLVEDGSEEGASLHDALFSHLGKAHRIGITGPPGAGKSTLVGKMVQHLREKRKKTGVVAIDPTSPFTGGAFLGDRVRMGDIAMDSEVFIRSLATRGTSGGLTRTTKEVCDLLDAFGKEVILIETAGVGQSELEIASTADTTIVVLVPESGDSIQAMKAGLMEIGDAFCINKADRSGADETVRAIQEIVHLIEDPIRTDDVNREDSKWDPPVVKTVATDGNGIDQLLDVLEDHRVFLREKGLMDIRRRESVKVEIERKMEEVLRRKFIDELTDTNNWDLLIESVVKGEETPQGIADKVIKKIWSKKEK
jgi:LAO/AO transport system kinase